MMFKDYFLLCAQRSLLFSGLYTISGYQARLAAYMASTLPTILSLQPPIIFNTSKKLIKLSTESIYW